MATDLAILETSEWFKNSDISVRGIFDVLAEVNHSRHQFTFKKFRSRATFNREVAKSARSSTCLYIGAHGVGRAIECESREYVKATDLRALLNGGPRPPKVQGLYLGVCGFLSGGNARCLLRPGEGNDRPLQWVAGYRKDTEWFWTLMLDGLFFSAYLWEKYTHPDWSEMRVLKKTIRSIETNGPGLIPALGFEIYARSKTARGGIESLLR